MVMHRRPRELGQVVRSVNAFGEGLCVDFFRRPDGSFGFEEYRRDAESGEGWFPIGFYSERRFQTLAQAERDAMGYVAWLSDEM